ncbi:cytochrome P450 76T24-like [Quercus robur]|uniref:cytochrome P450 76T24-like n=1 Tax=Quercus robur TaxID=38942 RepID=UPI002162BE35|nr:cytochrome P450 76T24-like [Quercus robur]
MARVYDHHEFSVGWLPTNSKWKNLRKACTAQILATQCLDATQALRQTKVQELIDHVNQSCQSGSPTDIDRLVFTTVLNSISNTFFSMDMAQYDSQLSQEFRDLVCGVAKEIGRPNIADCFPALRFLDPQGILDGIIKQRLQSRASSMGSKAGNDVLNSLHSLIEKDNSEMSLLDIKHLLMDLFLAEIGTISTTMEWAMTVLLQNPEKMAKPRDELKEVLGKDEHVQESDISKFHYLRGIVKETFRLHNPVPFLVPHKAETNVEMCGFIVPKNVQILIVKDKITSAIQNSNIKITQLEDNSQDYSNPAHR